MMNYSKLKEYFCDILIKRNTITHQNKENRQWWIKPFCLDCRKCWWIINLLKRNHTVKRICCITLHGVAALLVHHVLESLFTSEDLIAAPHVPSVTGTSILMDVLSYKRVIFVLKWQTDPIYDSTTTPK